MLRLLELFAAASAASAAFTGASAEPAERAVGDIAAHRHEGVLGASISEDTGVDARFVAFLQAHGRTYAAGSAEYAKRFEAFQGHFAAVQAQNSKPGRRWTAAVNPLADRTSEELASLRGYVHGARPGGHSSSAGLGQVGLVSTEVRSMDLSKLPKDWNWKQLNAMQDVKDQGPCGSCWAVSSATVLRAHAELYQKDRTFSVQQIIDCTPNPRGCGGDGGCKGATAELAMEYVAKVGAVTEDELGYSGSTAQCPSGMEPHDDIDAGAAKTSVEAAAPKGFLQAPDTSRLSSLSEVKAAGGASFGMVGWRKFPENKMEPLLLALYENGPVVVSVAANAQWSLYSSGVLDACEKDAVINHAVTLAGYGEEGDAKYWLIQNSWGPHWGEDGFVRLARQDNHGEGGYCGWDHSPEQGTACKGGPNKVKVCGSCGILYDAVAPSFLLSEHGYLTKHGLRNLTTSASTSDTAAAAA